MILLNAVSGFNGPDDLMVDGDLFKKVCYSIMNNLHGTVISFSEPEIARNYYQVEVMLNRDKLYILLNISYPFVAFASSVDV